MKDTPIITAAKMMAGKAHEGQFRKYSGLPYIIHPIEVATTVEAYGGTDEMIAAALLHDVVEDCPGYTVAMVADEVSPLVAEYVDGLTDVSKPEDGNRSVRKALDLEHLAGASPAVQTIKYADILSNTTSIVADDPSFAEVYLPEVRAILDVMPDGDPALYARVKEAVG
jgi:(p)ppGpp synthase/HD superfamily hydrolase|tara:strand:+ start:2279 stop:2785 length:507 start_codon:yes stop_codon:yes gene_type:complete